MTVLTDAQWRLVEDAYRTTTEPIAVIAKRYSISAGAVSHRRTKFGWPPRRAGAIKKQAKPVPKRLSDKAAIVARIYRLINLKLEQLEKDMSRPGERTPADHERETRALGTLVRNYERVSGLEREGNHDGKQDGEEPERRAEAEAIRRELAEQIVRLRQTEPGDDA